jgi:hypothetical protein
MVVEDSTKQNNINQIKTWINIFVENIIGINVTTCSPLYTINRCNLINICKIIPIDYVNNMVDLDKILIKYDWLVNIDN